jgi:hypothetical protein
VSVWPERPPKPIVSENDGPVAHQYTAPHLPDYGLTSIQVVCARELSKGRKATDVRKQYMIEASMWKQWIKDPMFTNAVSRRLHRLDQLVEDNLKDGEAQASATLIAALGAETPVRHKDGKVRMHPNWEVRVRSAISLLDRRGERGKPVERVQAATQNWNITEVRSELSQALADPAVRAFLAADPAFAERLRQELRQLPPAQEAPCPDSAPSSPSSPPSSA